MIIFTNIIINELFLKIMTVMLKDFWTTNKIIIHLHIIFFEYNIIWNKVKKSHNLLSLIIHKDELDVFMKFDVVKTIYEIYKNTDWSKSIVMNKKVQLIEHNLITWMLWITDVISLHLIFDSDSWKKFWEYYN